MTIGTGLTPLSTDLVVYFIPDDSTSLFMTSLSFLNLRLKKKKKKKKRTTTTMTTTITKSPSTNLLPPLAQPQPRMSTSSPFKKTLPSPPLKPDSTVLSQPPPPLLPQTPDLRKMPINSLNTVISR